MSGGDWEHEYPYDSRSNSHLCGITYSYIINVNFIFVMIFYQLIIALFFMETIHLPVLHSFKLSINTSHSFFLSFNHYNDVIMSAMASQITSLAIVYSTVYSGADQRKYQSSAPLAFVWVIHWWPVNSPHKGPVTRKMFTFDDVIMIFMYIPVPTSPYCLVFSELAPKGVRVNAIA